MVTLPRRSESWLRLEDDASGGEPRKKRWFWMATIGFVVSAVVLPTVMLAATGHFSSASGVPNGSQSSEQGSSGEPTDAAVIVFPTGSPTQSTIRPSFLPTEIQEAFPTTSPVLDTTSLPSVESSAPPTGVPSNEPSSSPSLLPTEDPSSLPTVVPSMDPSTKPSLSPSRSPSEPPSEHPSSLPSAPPTALAVTYRPGQLTVHEKNLFLSTGLTARIVARHNQFVPYHNGTSSKVRMHQRPDFGATYAISEDDKDNPGGWIYVSNAEMKVRGTGGVGAFTFDRHGRTIAYDWILDGTTWNCGGGKTPWNTWVSCEEVANGQIYQVDPFGKRTAEKMTMGKAGGRWESFSYDVRNRNQPRFFVTEDAEQGALRRFTPSSPNWNNPWTMLHGEGTLDYLVLEPNGKDGGTFRWVQGLGAARANAKLYYSHTEGIDVRGSQLYMVAKKIKQLFVLDLDDGTYQNQTTVSGLFDGGPDQLSRILDDDDGVLYFTEEGGRDAGVHARNRQGQFFTILESRVYEDETTGLAFSPDGRHLYVAYQESGVLYDVTRRDGRPFHGKTLNVKYHAAGAG